MEDRDTTSATGHGLLTTFFWCLGIAVALTLVLVSFERDGARALLGGFLVNFIISLSIGYSLHTVFVLVLPRLLERFQGRVAFWVSHVVMSTLAVGLGTEIAIWLIAAIGGPAPGEMRPDVLRIGLVVALTVMTIGIAFERLRERARRVELRAQQAQREALQARLSALQARTNPHFLFNALNSVAGLIDEDPAAAERALEKMSRLFRYSLDGSKTAWVRLAAELEVVEDYLEVEGLRLGERLHVAVEAEKGVEGLLVPPLVLQPLVENAVLHAVAPRRKGGRVKVRAARNGRRLLLSVVDDGPGFGNSPHRGSGGSLADLERRLEMTYGGEASIETGAAPGGGCRVEVGLPIREGA